jgi:hypothetical protein
MGCDMLEALVEERKSRLARMVQFKLGHVEI